MDLGADLRGKVSLLSVFFDDCPKGIRENFLDLCTDRKSTRLNSSHLARSRMPSSA